MIVRALYFIISGLLFANSFGAQLKAISFQKKGAQTSIYLKLNGSFTYKVFYLNNPERVVIDFKKTQLGFNLQSLHVPLGLIKKVRSGYLDSSTLRLVLEMNQKVQPRTMFWRSNGNYKELRVDLDASSKSSESNHAPYWVPSQSTNINKYYLTKNQRALEPKVAIKKQNLQMQPILSHPKPIKTSNKFFKPRDVIVILDAGHGGKDPGAKGLHNNNEKDVVLTITLKLRDLINRQPGMRAVLTRSGDYYVGLRQRLHIARKYNADVFVAIHADAFNNTHSSGASVFALSQRGATSEAARWIAEKENYSELGGVNLGDLDDQNGVVRSVLIDLSQTATINSSLQMGGRVLNQLGAFTHLHNPKVEQARFMVLKSPDIPSILVETGFISNPIEERNLTNNSYQNRLSQAIFQGIKGYFWENPPQGSRIEAMLSNKKG